MRRSRPRLVRAVSAALLLLVTCAWAGPAQAQAACSTACVVLTIGGTDGAVYTREVPLSAIQAAGDRGTSNYQVRSVPGGPVDQTAVALGATSVRALLIDVLKIAPEQVETLTVQRVGAAGAVTLSQTRHDFDAPGTTNFPFEDGNPPVFYAFSSQGDTAQVAFIRALRTNDSLDTNSNDAFQDRVLRGSLTTSGRTLHPNLVATPKRVDPSVETSLKIDGYDDGDGPTGNVTYTWDFDDASVGPDAPSTSHAWKSRSTYRVTVTVQADDGSAGVGSVDVVVGKKRAAPGQPGGGGGAEDGANHGGPGNGTQAGGSTTSPGGTGSSGTSTRPGRSGDAANGQDGRPAAPGSKRRDQTPTLDGGDRVTGRLLDAAADTSVTVPVSSSAPVAAATTHRRTDLPRDWRWVLALLPLLLLAGGMLRQTRWLAPRLPEPPWRRT